MRQFVLVAVALALAGCQTQNYYACRRSGGSREACDGLPGTPT